MVKSTYKIQKLTPKGPHQSIPSTKYEDTPASLKNFPSSVVNGITAEGGLFSLTFKSISCAKLVENLDLMREALIYKESEDIIIRDDEFDATAKLQELRTQDNNNDDITTSVDQRLIADLQTQLQNVLQNKTDISSIGEDIKSLYSMKNPNKILGFNQDQYSLVEGVEIPNHKVETFEQVRNIDMKAYERVSE